MESITNADSMHEKSVEKRVNLQSFIKYLRLILVFMWNSAQFCLLVLTKIWFRKEEWALGCHSMKFRPFSDIS